MASSTVLKPTPCSASPGIGSVRATDPSATTTVSYSTSYRSPSSGSRVARRRSWSRATTRAVITSQSLRTRRRGTTTWRDGDRPLSDRKEHTSELQSRQYLVCRLLLEKKKKQNINTYY